MVRAVRHRPIIGILFVLPTVVVVCVFTIAPLFSALQSSLTIDRWIDPFGENGMFVGLGNYYRLLQDPVFQRVVRNTAVFVATIVPANVLIALSLALLISAPLQRRRLSRKRDLVRLGFLYPAVLPMIGAGAIWLFLLNRDFGLINQLLQALSIPRQNWLGNPNWALPSVMLVTMWRSSSYYMIFFLAYLQLVPPELLEAGSIDGAGGFQRIWHIVLPSLRNGILFVATIALADAFQTYDQIAVLTNDGGPNNATNLLLFNIRIQFSNGNYDLANAQSVILVLIIFALTAVARTIAERSRNGR